MRPPSPPATVQIALFGERGSGRTGEHIHAVLAWTDRGERHYQAMAPRLLSSSLAATTGDRAGAPPSKVSSAGHGWRTWLLDSIPGELRHLPPAGAAQALATRLGH